MVRNIDDLILDIDEQEISQVDNKDIADALGIDVEQVRGREDDLGYNLEIDDGQELDFDR
ncbi:MAG: hypothetical protein CMF62_11290 [Magnetococcales bacterium]|nr:hypothetical protein [Magnetococcales bacterium]|tara:strand:- start:22405 stop:22584 length:180 start_codon:yes stop_codon:yes gene_type:complete